MLFQSFTRDRHGSSCLLPTNAAGPLPQLHFVLTGKIDYGAPDLGKIALSTGEYTLLYWPSSSLPWTGLAGRKMVTFTIGLPIDHLQALAISFPALLPFQEKVRSGIACQFTETPGMADLRMIGAIRRILSCAFHDHLKNIYWDLQVSNLITMALVGLGNEAGGNGQITLKPPDIEKIEATRSYLLQNMDCPPTLIDLAHKMGLNDFKLKKAYKQLYGTTVFGDFLHARMKRAKSLLEKTDQSIVGIAELAGYKNVSSFSVAFKKYFGITPGKHRKKL